MNIVVGRFLCHHGTRKIRTLTLNVLRLSSTEESNPSKSDSCPVQVTSSCSPPPCPPKPSCPPTLCPKIPDPNNPCNYCPPPCIDPDYPDLTKLKKLQCKFQEKNDIPVHLKGGSFDVYLYHASIIMTVVSVLTSLYFLYAKA